jgi:hypothetical protein
MNNSKKKQAQKPSAQTRKIRDLPAKKNPKGGIGGGIHPSGPGG